jgi:hypothetical protein
MADPARGTAKELCELGRSRRTQKIFRGPSVAHRPRVGPYHTRLVGGPGTRGGGKSSPHSLAIHELEKGDLGVRLAA